jgi:2-methylcitrate dehydratase PrpD
LFSALLAARDFTSAAGSIEGANGFAATHSGACNGAAAFAEPPGGYFLRQNLFKYHAACYMTHAAANAITESMTEHGVDANLVEHVGVTVDESLNGVCNIARPVSGLEMKFSLRTVAALALLGRDTSRLSSFSDGAVSDAQLSAAREKVEVTLSNVRPITRSRVHLRLKGGQSFETEHDSGRPETNLAVQKARLQRKFQALAGEVLGAGSAGQLLESIDTLDTPRDISVMLRLASQ